jgi:hypothetical protein
MVRSQPGQIIRETLSQVKSLSSSPGTTKKEKDQSPSKNSVILGLSTVVYAYSEGRDQEDCGSKPAQAKSQ